MKKNSPKKSTQKIPVVSTETQIKIRRAVSQKILLLFSPHGFTLQKRQIFRKLCQTMSYMSCNDNYIGIFIDIKTFLEDYKDHSSQFFLDDLLV